MSDIRIKPMETEAETEGKALVHWSSWQEAYATGEVFALYVLKEYYGAGVGRRLMDAALEKLAGVSRAALWVLENNKRAIRFYEKCGFQPDGARRTLKLGTDIAEIRMALDRRK